MAELFDDNMLLNETKSAFKLLLQAIKGIKGIDCEFERESHNLIQFLHLSKLPRNVQIWMVHQLPVIATDIAKLFVLNDLNLDYQRIRKEHGLEVIKTPLDAYIPERNDKPEGYS